MSRGLQRSAVALITASLAAVSISAQGNQGILFSEVVHGPTIGGGMPSYIELVNVRIANPTIPPPVQMNGTVITASVNNQPPHTVTIAGAVLLGGNVQPPPAA